MEEKTNSFKDYLYKKHDKKQNNKMGNTAISNWLSDRNSHLYVYVAYASQKCSSDSGRL